MRFQFIQDHASCYAVERMCAVLGVSRSGYYAWRRRGPSARKMANQELLQVIRRIHQESRQTYGSPRIYQELRAAGIACSENRVARLMQEAGLYAKQRRRFRRTTQRNKAHRVAPNLLRRGWQPQSPDQVWVADITYIATDEGWLYLASIMDRFSRRIVGWALQERLTATLTRQALRMALAQRQPAPGLIHHSDRGSQYTEQSYRRLLQRHGALLSMSSTGNCFDNAHKESFFATLKTELVHRRHYHTRAEARTDIFYYIEGFYNSRRRHSALHYLSPQVFEAVYSPQIT